MYLDVNIQTIVTSKTSVPKDRLGNENLLVVNNTISCVESFSKSLTLSAISETASQLITEARRESSTD